jgi:hypothetical protein
MAMQRYGSLQNLLATSEPTSNAPKPGDGATIYWWTDRTPATVERVEIVRGRTRVHLIEDRAIRTDGLGMTDAQSYRFEPDPDGRRFEARLIRGRWMAGGQGVTFGHRSAYRDFSF